MERAPDPAQERGDPGWASEGETPPSIVTLVGKVKFMQPELTLTPQGPQTHDNQTHRHWTPTLEKRGNEVEESVSGTQSLTNLGSDLGSESLRKHVVLSFSICKMGILK